LGKEQKLMKNNKTYVLLWLIRAHLTAVDSGWKAENQAAFLDDREQRTELAERAEAL